jgi:hypothetical protein
VPYKDPAVRKAKHKEYSARHYRRNTEQRKAEIKANKTRVLEWWQSYKATLGCFGCDENDPACLDFHHVITDGKRNNDDSAARWLRDRGFSQERMLEEIWNTCVPLCANCHRKVHAQHKIWAKEENASSE